MINSYESSIALIKNSQIPIIIRKEQLQKILLFLLFPSEFYNNIFIQGNQLFETKQLPRVLQSLYSYSKFQLSNLNLSQNLIIAVLFLKRLNLYRYITPIQAEQIKNKLIDLVVGFQPIDDNYQIQYEFLFQTLEWISIDLIEDEYRLEHEIINELINKNQQLQRQLNRILNLKLTLEDKFLMKILFWIKINGLDHNTSLIFQKNIKVLDKLNNKLPNIAKSLSLKVMIRYDEEQMHSLYNKLCQLDRLTKVQNIITWAQDIIEILTVTSRQYGYISAQFMKMQRIMFEYKVQDKLFKIIFQNKGYKVLSKLCDILVLCAKHSYWSCQKILKYFKTSASLNIFQEDWGQFKIISQIASSQILIEPQHYNFVKDLFNNKKYIASSDNYEYVEIVNLLSKQFFDKKKITSLIQGPHTFRRIFNIESKQLVSKNIVYVTKCVQFLNNLRDGQRIKELCEWIPLSVDVLQLISLLKSHDFYISPSKQSLQQLILEMELFRLIFEYNVYQTIPEEELINMLMETSKYHLKMLRQYNENIHENTLQFIEQQELQLDKHDIIFFCSQILYVVLILSARQISQSHVNESNKLSLKRMSLLLVGQILIVLQKFMGEKEYNQRKNIVNKLLKVIDRDFKIQPQFKYYYNYNMDNRIDKKQILPDTIFKRQKMFMSKYQLTRSLFEYSFSDELKGIIQKSHEKANERFELVLKRNEAIFISHLVFVLKNKEFQQNHGVICQTILKLLDLNKRELQNLIIEYEFVQIFYKLIESESYYFQELIMIANKLMQPNSKQMNKTIQLKFEKVLEQQDKTGSIMVMKKHIEQFLEIQQAKEPTIKQVEKCIKYKAKDSMYSSFGSGMVFLIFIQLLCQSLNLNVKSLFGYNEDRSESILILLVRLLNILTKDLYMISLHKATIIVQCLKTISSLVRGPHQKNTQRILYHGYHQILLSILLIDDSLSTIIEKANGFDVRKQIVSRAYLKFLQQNNQNFYEKLLKPQIILREQMFDIKQIASLKKIVLSQSIVIIDFLSKNTLKIFYDTCKQCMIDFMNKAQKIYGHKKHDLERLVINKKIDNLFDKIIAFEIENVFFNQPQMERYEIDIKESLYLEIGINLFILMSKYEEKQNLSPIKQAVYKYLNSLRLKKRYNEKGGILYQIYRIFKDIISTLTRGCMRIFKMDSLIDRSNNPQQRSQEQKYTHAINFFAKNIANLQVNIHGKNTTISFPLLQQQRCINKSIRRDLKRNIDYLSITQGLRTFMNQMDVTLLRLKQQKNLSQLMNRNKILGIIIRNRELWKNLSFFVAVLQNFIMMFQLRIEYEVFISIEYTTRVWQYFFASLLFIIFAFESFKLRKLLAEQKIQQRKMIGEFRRFAFITWYIIKDKTLLFVIYYVTWTSVAIKWNVAISLLLFDFFYRFKATRFLQDMVVDVSPSLLTNVIFIFLLIYLITIIIGNQSSQSFYGISCQNYAQCIEMIFYGMQKILFTTQSSSKIYSLGMKIFFSTTITMITVLLFKGLFYGIMIDQKRKVRHQKQQLQKQIIDRCFICGQTRSNINRKQGMQKGFKKHIELQHNMWNYVYYLSYLKNLPECQINIQQSIILDHLRNKSYEWIPIKQN